MPFHTTLYEKSGLGKLGHAIQQAPPVRAVTTIYGRDARAARQGLTPEELDAQRRASLDVALRGAPIGGTTRLIKPGSTAALRLTTRAAAPAAALARPAIISAGTIGTGLTGLSITKTIQQGRLDAINAQSEADTQRTLLALQILRDPTTRAAAEKDPGSLKDILDQIFTGDATTKETFGGNLGTAAGQGAKTALILTGLGILIYGAAKSAPEIKKAITTKPTKKGATT